MGLWENCDTLRLRGRTQVISYLALFFALGGVGPTDIVSPTGAVKACGLATTSETQANTRIIDESASCTPSRMPITLSQASEPRPTGSSGQPGSARPPVSSSVNSEAPIRRVKRPVDLDARLKTTQVRDRLAVKIPGRRKVMKSKDPVAPVRVAVSQDSGGVEYKQVPDTDDYIMEIKRVTLECPQSAPNVLWGTVVGTAGKWDVSWLFASGSYRPVGATRDVIHAFITGDAVRRMDREPYNSFYAPLAPFTFRVEGECSN